MKVIFLDIDGVLNGYSKFTGFLYYIFSKLHLLKFVKNHYDLFGIRTRKVKILKRIINKTGAKVVLSSSWRSSWYNYTNDTSRDVALRRKFKKYKIEVVGITPYVEYGKGSRSEEINQYINEHPEIASYVIIDDEMFNFTETDKWHLVKTSSTDHITGAWYENTGLKMKHIKPAVEILNNQKFPRICHYCNNRHWCDLHYCNGDCNKWKRGKCYSCLYYKNGEKLTEEETDDWYKRGCETFFPGNHHCKNYVPYNSITKKLYSIKEKH